MRIRTVLAAGVLLLLLGGCRQGAAPALGPPSGSEQGQPSRPADGLDFDPFVGPHTMAPHVAPPWRETPTDSPRQ